MLPAPDCAFAPVIDQRTRVVILGSLPGAMSLLRRQYYAQPTNQFWRLAGAVIARDFAGLGYADRLEILLEAGIGLWDTIAEASRKGSLDSAIRDPRLRDLHGLLASWPNIRALAFNGAKSASIGRRQLAGEPKAALIDLPSSSAAYCAITFEAKLARWQAIAPFLSSARES